MEAEYPIYNPNPNREEQLRSATVAIQAIVPLDILPIHKKELLSICIWKVTQADGKYNLRYWSEGAIRAEPKSWRHEHVIERKELVRRLLDGESVRDVVDSAVACVVTVEEHKLLNINGVRGWDRYQHANVRVYDAANRRWMEGRSE